VPFQFNTNNDKKNQKNKCTDISSNSNHACQESKNEKIKKEGISFAKCTQKIIMLWKYFILIYSKRKGCLHLTKIFNISKNN